MVPDEIRAIKPRFTWQQFARLPGYIVGGLKYHTAGKLYIPKPMHSSLRVTRRCNSRCVMCRDWKTPADSRDITVEEIRQIYSSPLFSSLHRIGFSGGEPTLRADLAEIAEAVLSACPQITEMRLVTNGLEPDTAIQRVGELLDVCQRKGISRFSVSVSLDGYGPVHQEIRRVPQAFERVSETLRQLKCLQTGKPFDLNSSCVVQRMNFEHLLPLAEFASGLNLPLTFIPVRFNTSAADDQNASPELTGEQIKQLSVIFQGQLRRYLTPSNFVFWQRYFAMHRGEKTKRSLPCYLLWHFVDVNTDGTLSVCVQRYSLECGNAWDKPPHELWYSNKLKELRRSAEKSICPGCTDCCDLDTSVRMEFFFYAGFWLRERIKELNFIR